MFPFGIAPASHTCVIVKLCCLALFLLAAAPAKAQTPVEFGDTISEPGLYFLHGNQSGNGTGIVIESDDVTLLLLRFTLRGDGSNPGILSLGNDNVTILGGRITRCSDGIVIEEGSRHAVKDTRIDHSLSTGLFLREVKDSWFSRLRCDNNGLNGVDALHCNDVRLLSILAHDNGRNGINMGNDNVPLAGEETGNRVRLCWAAYNRLDGIRVFDSRDHEIVTNQCVGNHDAGIRLDSLIDLPNPTAVQADGPQNILVKSNWCVFNHDGIVVEWNARFNTLTNNTALANSGRDLSDHNTEPPCDNTWFLNFFLSKDGDGEDCIF